MEIMTVKKDEKFNKRFNLPIDEDMKVPFKVLCIQSGVKMKDALNSFIRKAVEKDSLDLR